MDLFRSLDSWSFFMLAFICFLLLFTVMYQIKPISQTIAEGFADVVLANKNTTSQR
jgi:hypothetical protein